MKKPRITSEQRTVLERARKLLSKKWGTGDWEILQVPVDQLPKSARRLMGGGETGKVRLPEKYIRAYCALGGLERALWIEMGKPAYREGNGAYGFGKKYDRAYYKLISRLEWSISEDERGWEGRSVVGFNDDYTVGHEDVLRVFDRAIA